MKKALILVLLFKLSSTVSAQHTGFYVGLNAAIQKTEIVCSDDTQSESQGQIGFKNTFKQAFGLDLGYQFNPKMGIQTGILYSEEGQKYTTPGNPIASFKTDLSYLKFPVLFCYRVWPDKKFSFIGQAGFQFSLLSQAKSSRKNVFEDYSPAYVEVKNDYTTLPLEFALGLGLQYSIHKISILALCRMDYSFSDIEVTDKKPGLRAPASNFTLGIPQLGIQYFFK